MLKKIFVIVIFLIHTCIPVFSYSENTLDNLELSKYGKTYSNEDLGSRLRRLETDIFGMSQSGNPDKRMGNLIKMASQDSYYQNFEPYKNTYLPEKKNIVKRFFDNVSSTFSTPAITGYTPSFYNSGFYPNNIYSRKYNNFLNNPNRYRPYNNSYYFNNYRNNPYSRYYNNTGFNSAIRNRHYNPRRHNSYYKPYITANPYGIIPTDVNRNIATRSTVHILRD